MVDPSNRIEYHTYQLKSRKRNRADVRKPPPTVQYITKLREECSFPRKNNKLISQHVFQLPSDHLREEDITKLMNQYFPLY